MFYSNVFVNRNKLYHIGYDKGEKFIKEETNFKPYLSIPTNKTPDKRSYHNQPLEKVIFNSIKEQREYKKNYGDLFKIYDDINPAYQFINETYPDKLQFDMSKLRVLLYDIENKKDPVTNKFSPPHEAKGEITAITIIDVFNKVAFCLSTEKFYPEQMEREINSKLHYKFCYSEKELLTYFIKLIDKIKPDILSAYNGSNYDDPYLINRCLQTLPTNLVKKLSPTRGEVKFDYKYDDNNNVIYRSKVDGVALIDYMELYQKNVKKYESNTLSFVAGVELGEDKISYEEYDNLEELRIKNPQKYVEYNIIDVDLLDKINDKRKLFELVITVAYFTKSNFDDVMSPIKTWDNFIYGYLNKQDIAIPPYNSEVPVFHIPGGYVKKDVNPSIYENVISLDLKALYPSLSITLNISPDTLIEENPIDVNLRKIDDKILYREIKHNDKNSILTGSGWKFRKGEMGFYPSLFQLLMDERDVAKGVKLELDKKRKLLSKDDPEYGKINTEYSNYHTFEQSVKLLMNSGYGILANSNCRYYDPRLAASITLSGQLAIKSASNVTTEYLEKKFGKTDTLLFTHTDSCFLHIGDLCTDVEDVDNFYKKELDSIIKKCYEELCDYLNANKNLLILKREKICSHYLLTAPARYACLITDKEGVRYSEPELEITGMEIVRSSTPKYIKPYLKETIIKMMKNENVLEYTNKVKKDFFKQSPEVIAFPRSANNLSKWVDNNGNYKSGMPIGVRAAHNFNRYVDKLKLDVNRIVEGDKIKFIYMKTPNPIFNQNVMGFIRKLPDDRLIKFVDYKKQFDKVYFDVISKVANNVGFRLDKDKESLEDIF